jgi:hypothetical protein
MPIQITGVMQPENPQNDPFRRSNLIEILNEEIQKSNKNLSIDQNPQRNQIPPIWDPQGLLRPPPSVIPHQTQLRAHLPPLPQDTSSKTSPRQEPQQHVPQVTPVQQLVPPPIQHSAEQIPHPPAQQAAVSQQQPQQQSAHAVHAEPKSSGRVDHGDAEPGAEFVAERYSDGSHYEGYKKGQARHGRGILHYVNGGVYDGEWRDGKMEGRGTMYFASGNMAYEGEFRDDKFEGRGVLYNEDPEKFEGEYDYNDFGPLENRWVKYDGEFKNDSKEGRGTMYISNGERIEAEFMEDKIHGRGVYFTLRGQKIHGLWEDDRLVSIVTITEAHAQ